MSVQLTIQADKYNNFQSNAIHKKYNFKKANFPRLYELLIQTDWTFLNKFSEINAACQAFYDALYKILDQTVPVVKYNKSSFKYPPWFSVDLIKNLLKGTLKLKKSIFRF